MEGSAPDLPSHMLTWPVYSGQLTYILPQVQLPSPVVRSHKVHLASRLQLSMASMANCTVGEPKVFSFNTTPNSLCQLSLWLGLAIQWKGTYLLPHILPPLYCSWALRVRSPCYLMGTGESANMYCGELKVRLYGAYGALLLSQLY